MTRFSCIAKDGAEIDARACVERQLGERCHCPKAVYAINAYAETYDRTSLKQREDLDVMRARACGFYKKPAVDQYAGPALEAQRAKEVPPCAEPIPATGDDATTKGTIPAAEPVTAAPEVPSGRDPRLCVVRDCMTQLRGDNQSGMCGPHTMEARTISGAKRLGVPRLVYPSTYTGKPRHPRREKGNVVSIKDVPRSVVEKFEGAQPGKVVVDQTLPDVRTLPHEYLVACCKEARRRIEEMDVLFTFTTQGIAR